MSVSIGLPDRVLAPLLRDDCAGAVATDLVAAFMLKVTANSYLGRGYLSQAITVGGRPPGRGPVQCADSRLPGGR